MAREDDKSTVSRRQIVGTAAIGAAGIAGGIGLGKAITPEPALAQRWQGEPHSSQRRSHSNVLIRPGIASAAPSGQR